MNSDMSKAEIYEYGKRLVDNSKSEEQIALEESIHAKIKELKDKIEDNKGWINMYEDSAKQSKEWGMMDLYKMDKFGAKCKREENKKLRNEIKALKWVLA